MQTFANASSGDIVLNMADEIIKNRGYLSDIDGKIGDGDHGVNMAKGFTMAAERIRGHDMSLAGALDTLGTVLLTEIGGSMGPLYGVLFMQCAETIEGKDQIDAELFAAMLASGLDGIQSIGSAQVGDKTLLDALVPALAAFNGALADGKSFAEALDALVVAAEKGRDSTKEMTARVGRASRLGERSIGVLDAGATSCALILKVLATDAKEKLAAAS
ncbi:dihydroxyacetone kinase subunit DhaL [Rhodobium gokarnense]|uniref:Dihydroxyacetone kinase-like protein n=1 Tax=Rhodobium gokarnense TaxID=364296 RepID=A0ABT3HF36_9HYPH|nr:dihydroxyacetone kinase subunit DhaL [Rhodobium gokarnense]MCW2309007.1 dihydroxyacetone kinase-like protein [Rhodobium gokarnense]